MKWGLIIGLCISKMSSFAMEPGIQFSQDAPDDEEELVVFEDNEFEEEDKSELSK